MSGKREARQKLRSGSVGSLRVTDRIGREGFVKIWSLSSRGIMADSDENEPRIEETNMANIFGLGIQGCLRKTFLTTQCNYHQFIAHGNQNLTHCHSELKNPLSLMNLFVHELKAEQKSRCWCGTRNEEEGAPPPFGDFYVSTHISPRTNDTLDEAS